MAAAQDIIAGQSIEQIIAATAEDRFSLVSASQIIVTVTANDRLARCFFKQRC